MAELKWEPSSVRCIYPLYCTTFLTYQDYLDNQDYFYYIVFETLGP